MNLNDAIKTRHSVKKFTEKKPDWRDIIECIDAARYAPMAGANYSMKFILVSDSNSINKIAEAAQQDFIKKAQYVVVACSNPSRTINAYGKSGEVYARQQAGAAMQNFLLSITEHKLATCWIGHFTEETIKKEFDIPKDVNVEAVFPIGYEREKKHTKKSPIDLDRILYFHVYDKKKMKKLSKTY